jgi:hypothetical protein
VTGPETGRPERIPVGSLVEIFHAAVAAGDARGVDASLRLIAVQDAYKAQDLYDSLDLALRIAGASGR